MAKKVQTLGGFQGSLMAGREATERSTLTNKKTNDGSTLGYLGARLGIGAAGIFEGFGDFVAGSIYQLTGDRDYAKYLHDRDITGGWQQKVDADYNPSGAMRIAGDIASGLGQALPSLGVGIATGGVGTAAQIAGSVGIGMGYAGRGVTAAVQKTGQLGAKENIYGIASGALEGATDALLGGVQKAGKSLWTVGKSATRLSAGKIARNGLMKGMLSAAGSEAAEEFIQEYADAAFLRVTGVDKNASVSFQDAMYSAMIGGITGGFLGGATGSLNAVRNIQRGNSIRARNLEGSLLATANYIRNDYLGKGANFQNIDSPALRTLSAAVDAYEKLAKDGKTEGNRGAMLLGEIQMGTLAFETDVGVRQRMSAIMANPTEEWARYASMAAGKTVTVDDLRQNKDGVTELLAVRAFAGDLMAESGTERVARMVWEKIRDERYVPVSEATAWDGNVPADGSVVFRTGDGRFVIVTAGSQEGRYRVGFTETADYDEKDLRVVQEDVAADTVRGALSGLADGSLVLTSNGFVSSETAKNAPRRGVEVSGDKLVNESKNVENRAENGDENDTIRRLLPAESESSSIKEQLRNHLNEVNALSPVAKVTFSPSNKLTIRENVGEAFRKLGYRIERKDFGVIEIGEKQIRKSMNYLQTNGELAALAAVPGVLKRGIDISEHDNHKGRSFKTVTFAAPVEINGVVGNVAVVVQMVGRNNYHTHRILMPDGSEFVFVDQKTDAEPTNAGVKGDKHRQGPAISSASANNIIAQNPEKSTVSDKKDSERGSMSVSENNSRRSALKKVAERKDPKTGKYLPQKTTDEKESRKQKKQRKKAEAMAYSLAAARNSQTSREKTEVDEVIISRGYSDTEANDARALVKDFDLLSAVQRRAIVELMRSGEASGASKNFMRHSANLIAYWRPGLWIMADEKIRDDGFYYVFEDGTRLITVNPKAEGRAVTETLMHELAHDVWARADEDVRDSLYQLAVKGVDDARINDIRKRYRDELKARGEDVTEELLREEVVVGILGETIGREDLLSRFDGEGRFPVVRRILRTLSNMKKRFVGKDKYLYRKADDLFVMFTKVMAGQSSNPNAFGNARVKFALKRYNEQQKENWKGSKRIILYENENQYRQFIRDSASAEYNKKIYFGAVSSELAQVIKDATGIDVENYNCSLSSSEVRKIFKSHGDKGREVLRGQRGFAEEDFIKIPLVLQSPDLINLAPKPYNGKPVIRFVNNTGENMTVVAVVSDKHLDLFVQTAYASVKKGNLASLIDEQAPIKTSETGRGTVPNNIIAQNEEMSTALEKKVSEDNGSTRRALARKDSGDQNDARDGAVYNAGRDSAAVSEFGTTARFDQAGFVLSDGRMLKLSQYGLSGVQHKLIERIYDDVKGEDAIDRFVQEGHVRVKASSPGIEIGSRVAPSTNQLNVISRFVSGSLRRDGVFYLDITGADGADIASVTYTDAQTATDVIFDIKDYFERGVVPRSSSEVWAYDSSNNGSMRRAISKKLKTVAGISLNEKDLELVEKYDRARAEYRTHMVELKSIKAELKELRKQKKDGSLTQEGKNRIDLLSERQKRLLEKMRTAEKQLLKMEALKPIENLIERERRQAKRQGTLAGEKAGQKKYERRIEKADKKLAEIDETIERKANEKAHQKANVHSKQLKKMVDDIMYLKHIVTHKKATDGGTVAAVLLEDPSLRAMVDFFAKRTTAYGLLHRSTREGIRAFLPWYTADNPILNDNAADDFFNSLGGAQNNVFGKFDAGMRGMMEALANGEGDISGQEIEYLQKVISGIGRLYVTYGKVKINGKWREGTALAEGHYHEQERLNKVLRARKDDDGKVQKGVRKIWRIVKESYLYGVVSPEAVLRDLENHSKDGVLSALYRDIRYGEAEAKKVRALILQPVAQFFADHKDYRRKLQTETAIQFNGMKLTRAQAVGLWETSLREQAQQRMFEQGVRLVDYNDDTRAVHEIKVSKTELDNLYRQFSEEDRAYIKALEESFRLSTKYKLETDTEVFGYTNVVSGHYYPITTDENYFSRDVTDLRDSMGMMQVLNNLSFNKNTVKGAQAWLFVEDSLKVLERHAMGIGNYTGLYLPMQTFGQVYGCRFDPTGMVGKVKEGTDFLVESVVKKTSLREYYSKIWSKHGVSGSNLDKYLTKLFADVQGVVGEKTMVDKVMGWIQGNMITASFGLNLKVIATQLASYGSAYKNLDADVLTQALAMKNGKQDWSDEGARMDKYSRLTLARSFDGVGAAEGLVDKLSEVGRLTTKGIDFTDRGVLIKLFEACQLQAEKDGRGALDSEDNLKAAGQMLDDLLLDTQTTSLKSDASSLIRSNNYLAKPFTMFRTESMKAFTNLYTTVSALVDHKRLADAGVKGYSELLKNDGKNIQRAAVSFMLSAAWVAAMTTLFTRMRRAVRGEEEDESIPVQYAGEVALGVAELFPVLSDFFGFMKDGYGVEAMPLTVINDSFTMLSGVGKLASSKSTQEEKARYLRQSVYTLGSLLGLPTRNAGRVALTTVSVVNRSAAYSINNASDTAPSYQSDLDRALAVGNDRLAATVISAWFERKKGGDTSEEVTAEILRLYGLKDGDGNNVLSMPKNVPSALEGKERTAFEKIYAEADGEAVALIGSAAYGKLSDAGKAAALKVCYDMAWTRAAQATALEVSESAVRLATAGAQLPLLAQVAGFANAFHGENKKAQIVQYMVSLGIGMVERDRYLAALGYKV